MKPFMIDDLRLMISPADVSSLPLGFGVRGLDPIGANLSEKGQFLSRRDSRKLAGGEARPDPSGLAGTTGSPREDHVPRRGSRTVGAPFLRPCRGGLAWMRRSGGFRSFLASPPANFWLSLRDKSTIALKLAPMGLDPALTFGGTSVVSKATVKRIDAFHISPKFDAQTRERKSGVKPPHSKASRHSHAALHSGPFPGFRLTGSLSRKSSAECACSTSHYKKTGEGCFGDGYLYKKSFPARRGGISLHRFPLQNTFRPSICIYFNSINAL